MSEETYTERVKTIADVVGFRSQAVDLSGKIWQFFPAKTAPNQQLNKDQPFMVP
jgi:hypothetical protein